VGRSIPSITATWSLAHLAAGAGDGRTNYRDPAIDLLADMVTASRHAHWLNPEPKHLWGSGDSAVPRYQEVITMHECRSAKQLAAVIDQLLPV
jgi:uncharacterized protein